MLLVMNTAGRTVYITVLFDFVMVALFDFVVVALFAMLLMYFACKYSKRLFILYSSLGSADRYQQSKCQLVCTRPGRLRTC